MIRDRSITLAHGASAGLVGVRSCSHLPHRAECDGECGPDSASSCSAEGDSERSSNSAPSRSAEAGGGRSSGYVRGCSFPAPRPVVKPASPAPRSAVRHKHLVPVPAAPIRGPLSAGRPTNAAPAAPVPGHSSAERPQVQTGAEACRPCSCCLGIHAASPPPARPPERCCVRCPLARPPENLSVLAGSLSWSVGRGSRQKVFEDVQRFLNTADIINQVVYDLEDSSLQCLSDSLRFFSNFECGNLRKAVHIRRYEYDLILNADANCSQHTQWFYFEVSNMVADVPYRFNVINCEKSNSQFNYGERL
ncbi:unnamed protein product [Pleuronectes platessa]|uniref:Cytosolic carboxypeptidase N-terminal domain-containing protein n=1 Tax=Pleuronectes platessa TaxID=8262 RepID=A0A9N7VC72_PLEPL|nr:unnamed protein product [Pleuronectes platessa]